MRPSRSVLVASVVVAVALGACSSSNKTSQPTTPKLTEVPDTPKTTTTIPKSLTNLRLHLQEIASGLVSTVDIAFRKGDSRIYVAEQPGRVRVIDHGRVLPTPVLTLAVSHGNEQGLLGITFSPDGTKLYVDYTDPRGDTHVVEYTMHGDVADPSTRRELLFQFQPFPNHNGGEVRFGPDKMLYIGLGDGGGAGDPHNYAQALDGRLGKILRIDPTPSGDHPYTVPADNPFVHTDFAKPEIYAYGLRNPWRFSFDRQTKDLWIGDVGQDIYEEIDWATAADANKGINWGWRKREALHPFHGGTVDGTRPPVLELDHDAGWCAVVGGYVYRGKAIPALDGLYLFGDNCRAPIVGLILRDGKVVAQREVARLEDLTSFGEDPAGELYAVSRLGGVYKITAG